MATRMGAPGVRIELHDRSGYSLVETPNAVGGVVGFAPKGELNKIQRLTNTAQQDLYFGLGFNNSRYNQGMYAARAVINAGGYVEFVRPYGEEIDKTSDFKRDLKTDTFVVAYDRNAVSNKNNPDKTSLKAEFFASTRYKVDGAAKYGVTRKINNIAETIVNNSNVSFNVDAAEDYNAKENWVANGGAARGDSDIVMFALMNADPSSANRAYSTFALDKGATKHDSGSDEMRVTCTGRVGFAVDDIVYAPAVGRTTELSTFRVTNIVDKEVSLKAEDDITLHNINVLGYVPEILIYAEGDNILSDGYDYLSVKTAVAGQGAKTFNSLFLDGAGLSKLKEIPSGTPMVFHDQDSMDIYVRVATDTALDGCTFEVVDETSGKGKLTAPADKGYSIWVGDVIDIGWLVDEESKAAAFVVTGVDESGFVFDVSLAATETIAVSTIPADVTAYSKQKGWVDSVNTRGIAINKESTVKSVVDDLVKVMRGEELGYGYAVVSADMAKYPETDSANAGKLKISEDYKTITMVPGGALEFVPGDMVAITRASVNLDVTGNDEPELSPENILYFGTVKTSDPITDTIELLDPIDSTKLSREEKTDLQFQLLNLTQSNKLVYAAVDSYNHVMDDVDMENGEAEYEYSSYTKGTDSKNPVYTVTEISGEFEVGETGAEVNNEVTFTWNETTCSATINSIESGIGYFKTVDMTSTNIDGTREGGEDKQPECVITDVAVVVAGEQVSITPTAQTFSGIRLTEAGADDTDPVYAVTGIKGMATCQDGKVAVGDAVKFKYVKSEDESVEYSTSVSEITTDNPRKYVFRVKFQQPVSLPGTRDHDEQTDTAPVPTISDITVHVSANDHVDQFADIYMVGNYTVMVPTHVQNETPVVAIDNVFVTDDKEGEAPFKYMVSTGGPVVDHSDKVLTDSSIGATFVGLGLANIKYTDANFTGNTIKVYDLTDEGEAVARLYLAVAYMYNGVRYEFDGTVVKYVYNDMQLFIGDSAETELEGSGVVFVLNDSGVMEMFREDNSYDLSSTVAGEMQANGTIKAVPSSTTLCPAFNTEDPAIVNNAVWTYDPANNMSTSTISNAFNLFLDKDKSDVTFFVGAGLGINNFGLKGYETLNTQLMQAVLSICELRKDCFALFDGAADSRIDVALKLDSPASRFGSTLGRWGAIYDARPIFYDSIVTKSNVEVAPSVAMASLITANRKGSIFWHVPAGEDTGMIPGAWCRKLKYERKFNYPEDPDSDIARLCDIHVNPFRSNRKGIYSYGDFTMQMEDTAFNAINVTMLVAGIHKMYYNYLDSRVFRLNTAALRAQITTDLQLQLDKIIGENPAGLDTGSIVICDDTNNPPEVVEAHKLYVDLMLYPTTSTRYIYLRTNVLSRSTGNVISTDISTGTR